MQIRSTVVWQWDQVCAKRDRVLDEQHEHLASFELWSKSTLCDGVSTVNGFCSFDEIAAPVSQMLDENREVLTSGGGIWDDVNGGWLLTNEVLRAAKEELLEWVHSGTVYIIVNAQEAFDAYEKPLDILWVDTDKNPNLSVRKIPVRLCVREFKTKKQGRVQRAFLASQLFVVMPPLE